MTAHIPTLHEAEEALVEATHSVIHGAEVVLHGAEHLLCLPEPPASRWHRAGITPRGERVFNVLSGIVVALFAAGWSWSIAVARAEAAEVGAGDAVTPVTAGIASALTDRDSPSAAYLTDLALTAVSEAVTPMRGESGRLRARIQPVGAPLLRDTLPGGATVAYSAPGEVVAPSDSAAAAPQSAAIVNDTP